MGRRVKGRSARNGYGHIVAPKRKKRPPGPLAGRPRRRGPQHFTCSLRHARRPGCVARGASAISAVARRSNACKPSRTTSREMQLAGFGDLLRAAARGEIGDWGAAAQTRPKCRPWLEFAASGRRPIWAFTRGPSRIGRCVMPFESPVLRLQRLTGAAQVGGCAPAPAIHAPHLDAMSLYASTSTSGEVVSYAAVARKTISYADKRFSIGGLRWVATDPAHRRAGLGARTIPAATRERRTATPGSHTEGTRGTVKSISRAGRTQKGRRLAAALDSRSKKKAPCGSFPHGAFPRQAKRAPIDFRCAFPAALTAARQRRDPSTPAFP